MTIAPDIAGFREAQGRKLTAFAEDVVFRFPRQRTYPAGTQLDAHGAPFDPTVRPDSDTEPSVTLPYAIADERRMKPGEPGAPGIMERGVMTLIGSAAVASATDGAVAFEARGERYAIRATRFIGIGGLEKHVVEGKLAS